MRLMRHPRSICGDGRTSRRVTLACAVVRCIVLGANRKQAKSCDRVKENRKKRSGNPKATHNHPSPTGPDYSAKPHGCCKLFAAIGVALQPALVPIRMPGFAGKLSRKDSPFHSRLPHPSRAFCGRMGPTTNQNLCEESKAHPRRINRVYERLSALRIVPRSF